MFFLKLLQLLFLVLVIVEVVNVVVIEVDNYLNEEDEKYMDDEGLLVDLQFGMGFVDFDAGSVWLLASKSNWCTLALQTLFILSASPFKTFINTIRCAESRTCMKIC